MVTIMKPPPQDDPRQPREAASTENRPPSWLLVIVPALTAVLFTNSWVSGSGSWPDWVYALLVTGSLALIVAVVIQRRRARIRRQ